MIFRIFFLCLFSIISIAGKAQDVIHLLNGQKVKAQVVEVGLDDVTYKSFSNLSGPELKYKKSEIQKIHYKNGSEEEFNPAKPLENRELAEKQKPAEPKPAEKKPSEKPIQQPTESYSSKNAFQFKRRFFLGINIGSSTPIGEYGQNIGVFNGAGYALTGYNFSIDFGYELHKNFGIEVNLFSTAHTLDAQKYATEFLNYIQADAAKNSYQAQVTTKLENCSVAGLLFGGYAQLPIKKLSLIFRLLGGYTEGNIGTVEISQYNYYVDYSTASRQFTQKPASASGFGFNIGGGARFNFNQKFYVSSNLDIIGFKPTFENVEQTENDYYGKNTTSFVSSKKGMSIFNFSIGAGMKFGKK